MYRGISQNNICGRICVIEEDMIWGEEIGYRMGEEVIDGDGSLCHMGRICYEDIGHRCGGGMS